jgi:hypothetical protein
VKAYKVFIRGNEGNSAYIGAESAGKAKALALKTTHDRRIVELGARRAPDLDDIARAGPITSVEALDSYDCSYWGIPVRFPS